MWKETAISRIWKFLVWTTWITLWNDKKTIATLHKHVSEVIVTSRTRCIAPIMTRNPPKGKKYLPQNDCLLTRNDYVTQSQKRLPAASQTCLECRCGCDTFHPGLISSALCDPLGWIDASDLIRVFLDAFSHLYERVCLSVGQSVRPRSVRPSVTHELKSWKKRPFGPNKDKWGYET